MNLRKFTSMDVKRLIYKLVDGDKDAFIATYSNTTQWLVKAKKMDGKNVIKTDKEVLFGATMAYKAMLEENN